mmetsp:Transcript_186/g.469  ORF Transcript_186/g.469 Transcript_186/m.469 type:complete len:331 (+) Transcript_186:281-1273(+)
MMIEAVPSIDLSLKGLRDGGLYTGEEVCAVFAESEEVVKNLFGHTVSQENEANLAQDCKDEEKETVHETGFQVMENNAIFVGTDGILAVLIEHEEESDNECMKSPKPSHEEYVETRSTVDDARKNTRSLEIMIPVEESGGGAVLEKHAPTSPWRKSYLRAQLLKRGISQTALHRMKLAVGRNKSKRAEPEMRTSDESCYSAITGSTGDFSDMDSMRSGSWSHSDQNNIWAAEKGGNFLTPQFISKKSHHISWSKHRSVGNASLHQTYPSLGTSGLKSVKLPTPTNLVKSLLPNQEIPEVAKDVRAADDVEFDGLSMINTVIGDDGFDEDY